MSSGNLVGLVYGSKASIHPVAALSGVNSGMLEQLRRRSHPVGKTQFRNLKTSPVDGSELHNMRANWRILRL